MALPVAGLYATVAYGACAKCGGTSPSAWRWALGAEIVRLVVEQVLLAATALLSIWLPARRAAETNPAAVR